MSAKTAFIIIDMQRCMADPSRPARNNLGAEANMQALLARWREADLPIVHVRHASINPNSGFWPGQMGADFQEAFLPYKGEMIIEKQVTDAFCGTPLKSFLQNASISKLIVAGVATNYSVEATARSAGCLGFDTIIAEDACFTFAREDLTGVLRTAEEIHVASLSNLSGEYAHVHATREILAKFAS